MKEISKVQIQSFEDAETEGVLKVSVPAAAKDFLTTEAMRVLTSPIAFEIRSNPPRKFDVEFVLCGGTALAKCYKITNRMSEDIDVRVTYPLDLSKSAVRNVLSKVKHELVDRFRNIGYEIAEGDVKAGNANRYVVMTLAYRAGKAEVESIKPHLLLEFSARLPLRPTVACSFQALIDDALQKLPEHSINCLAVRETLAGKTVALLRRWSARLRSVSNIVQLEAQRDEDIVRHIYDIHCVLQNFPDEMTNADAHGLVRETLAMDANEFGNQDPAFREQPTECIRSAIADLTQSSDAKRWYERFTRDMVYGDVPPFEAAMASVETFASHVWNLNPPASNESMGPI